MAGLMGSGWLTYANVLTLIRLVAAFPLYQSIRLESWWSACAIFWLAVATDFIDGRIARARRESSALGGLLDHVSDAIFVATGLAALVVFGRVAWPLPLLVGAAFLQYVLDSKAIEGRPLRSSSLGRWNGILYFVPIGVVVTRETLMLNFPTDSWVLVGSWALVLSTAISMGERAWVLLKARI